MLSRREWLSLTLATGAAAALDRAWLSAQQPLIMRAVPATNERLPLVGLGSSATFSKSPARRTSPQSATCSRRSSAAAAPSSTPHRDMARRKKSPAASPQT